MKNSATYKIMVTFLAVFLLQLALVGCPSKTDKPDKPDKPDSDQSNKTPERPPRPKTTISGTVVAPVPRASLEGITVAVYVGNEQVGAGGVDPASGAFKAELKKAGSADLRFTIPGMEFPFVRLGYICEEGKETLAGEIGLPADAFPSPPTPPEPTPTDPPPPSTVEPVTPVEPPTPLDHESHRVTISGNVQPPDTMVWVMKDGVEVKRTKAVDGKFKVDGLKHGLYTIEFAAPGRAPQKFKDIPMHADKELSTMLFMSTEIEGVNWDEGYIVVTGNGIPNPDAPNAASSRIGAQRAAKTDAYRRLLDKVLALKVDPDRTVGDYTQGTDVPGRIEGTVKGATFGEPETQDDGTVTIEAKVDIKDVAKTIMQQQQQQR